MSTDFYNYAIIAETGSTDQNGKILTGFSADPSINDAGEVAVVGNYSDGQGIIVGDGTVSGLKNIDPSFSHQTNRTLSPFLEINNLFQVAANDRASGSPPLSFERTWDATATDSRQDVALAGLPNNRGYGPWDAILSSAAINDNGDVVFPALAGTTVSVNLHRSGDPANTVTAIPLPGGTLAAPQALRPEISNNDVIVLQDGNHPTDPIVIYDAGSQSSQTIADSSMFDALGRSPGISANGQIVVFSGNLNAAGASTLTTADGFAISPGKAIFASISSGGSRILWPITTPSQFSDINLNGSVSVNSTQDPNLGNQRAVTIAYDGFNATTKIEGIYTSRLNFLGDGSGAFDPSNPKSFAVSTPTQVVQIGDTSIQGLGAISSLGLFDAVNNRDRGDVAFWASDGTNQAVVRARYQEVVYLDFHPQGTETLPYATAMFASMNAPAQWQGSTADVYAFYGRGDLVNSASTIQNDIVDAVQKSYDAVGAHVKFFGRTTDPLPQGGTYTQVLVGDGPNGSIPIPGADAFGYTYEDPFNGSVVWLNNTLRFVQRTPFIFADNIFRVVTTSKGVSAAFWTTDASGNLSTPIDLSYRGPQEISQADVENAMARVIEHEVGHNFGLDHLADPAYVDPNTGLQPYSTYVQYIMHDGTLPNELRAAPFTLPPPYPPASQEQFGTAQSQLDPGDGFASSDTQNDQARLAFSVGDNISPSYLQREAPIAAVLKSQARLKYNLAASLVPGSHVVAEAVLGIDHPSSDTHESVPDFIDLGSGDLSILLARNIYVQPGDQLFLVASTAGTGIDIFSVLPGTSANAVSIALPDALHVIADNRIRGNLFDSSGQPLTNAVDLVQMVNGQPVLLGQTGAAGGSTNAPPSLSPIPNQTDTVNTPLTLPASATDPDAGEALTYSLAAGAPGGATIDPVTGVFTWTPSAVGTFSITVVVTDNGTPPLSDSKTFSVVVSSAQQTPIISWASPSDIIYGTPLGAAELDATATVNGVPVSGTFTYSPATGTVLHAGLGQTLSVMFSPDDTADYTAANGSTTIDVLKATPVVTVTGVHVGYDGNPHPATATITGVNGDDLTSLLTLGYTPSVAPGTAPVHAGTYTATASFAGNSDYNPASNSATVQIDQAAPVFNWPPPAAIVYGTPLGSAQLDATASIGGSTLAGAFAYTPAAGTVLHAGSGQRLSALFTPADAVDFVTSPIAVLIDLLKLTPGSRSHPEQFVQ